MSTIDQDWVRDLIERHSYASGGNGRDFHNGAYARIAKEVNALGLGTCEDTGESRIFHCSECGLGLGDVYIDDELHYSPADFPRFCPWCGAKVVTNG